MYTDYVNMHLMNTCIAIGCTSKLFASKMCSMHYTRARKGHDINAKTRSDKRSAILLHDYALIELGTNSKFGTAKIDLAFTWIDKYNWHTDGKGYAVAKIDGKSLYMHRLITSAPTGLVVDHINHDTLDNRVMNLRVCTIRENKMNVLPKSGNKYKGIKNNHNRWSARIVNNKKEIYLGNYKTAVEAAIAYNKAAILYHGEFAHLNIIEGDK